MLSWRSKNPHYNKEDVQQPQQQDPCHSPAMFLLTKPSAGLISHLKVHFPAMYQLFLLLEDQKEPATEDEIAIADGKKVLDPVMAAGYLAQLQRSSSNLVDALHW
jgi:hypothetical protein